MPACFWLAPKSKLYHQKRLHYMVFKKVMAWLMLAYGWTVTAAYAAYNEKPTGIGGMAKNMLDPVFLLSDFVSAACFLIGGSFLFASIIKYIEHRRSPLMIPISTVVSLLIGGLLLIGLPFMWMLAKYANG